VALLLAALALPALGQTAGGLDPAVAGSVDRIVRETLAATGAPSASVAIVQDGRVVYAQAYGDADLAPRAPAAPEMRYAIGSVSKQFTAAAILMLAEDGKLSLDDPVSKFLPELTRANEVKIRQLLSHTSGYQDYWPQDYVPLFMRQPATAALILDRWAKKPLDFEPGTKYQYSNTGYVAAGVIVEKASGKPLFTFLAERVFGPLGMKGVANIDQGSLPPADPTGYQRFALGPPRVAPKEGTGWLFAAGELAMTAGDLALWNIGMIERKLMKPGSYRQMETEVLLSNGLGIGYGLGLSVGTEAGHRVLEHGGEVSGFTATNMIFPDDRAAVTVLANLDASDAAGTIAGRIAPLLFAGRSAATTAAEARARQVLEGLQRGSIDRALFTDDANGYFSAQAIADFASSLGPLGAPVELKQLRQSDRGGMTFRLFEVTFRNKSVSIWERDLPDGRIEQFQVLER
jgi:CubicO group peptidase (beta-lactamase class C family)